MSTGLEPLRDQEELKPLGEETESYSSGFRPPSDRYAAQIPKKPRSGKNYLMLFLLGLAVATSCVIIAFLARAIIFYDDSKNSKASMGSNLILPAWPRSRHDFLVPTYILLAAAVVNTVFGFISMVLICIAVSQVIRRVLSFSSVDTNVL